jgi:hypothetical protein
LRKTQSGRIALGISLGIFPGNLATRDKVCESSYFRGYLLAINTGKEFFNGNIPLWQ